MTGNNQKRAWWHIRLFLIGFTQTHYHPSLKKITGDVEEEDVSLDKPHICAVWRQSAAENDKWERVGREGEKPASVLQFIWSFISERERDRWRNMKMEGKAAEQKESRDFRMEKKKDNCVKSISIPSSSSPATTFSTHVCHCFLPVTSYPVLSRYEEIWNYGGHFTRAAHQ